MDNHISSFFDEISRHFKLISKEELAKALKILEAAYERDGRIYVIGNGGSLAIARHFVGDLNKTVFGAHIDKDIKRFQAIALPTTDAELTAWANDLGYDMVFAGPLKNYLQESDVLVAISSSGNSINIIKAVEVAKERGIPIIGLSGFDGGKLNELADAKVLVSTEKGKYEIVESIHASVCHFIIKYFKEAISYRV
ncbi:MAG: SIS domain-containing protein [Candidatus Wolfebacteria bacterium]|nr:SIS domain-containing protein [Candidatus Wolfebacteria bacterium]